MPSDLRYCAFEINGYDGSFAFSNQPNQKMEIDGFNAFILGCLIFCVEGPCKNSRGRLKQIDKKPKKVPIFYFDNLDGLLNSYKAIDKYLEVRIKVKNVSEPI